MVLLMCHTHYTTTQPKTPGLIDNALPNKNLKTNVMDDILIDISNGKQAVSTLAGIFVVNPALKLKTTHAHTRYLYARECCRRKTSGQCCFNAGPPPSMVIYIGPASVWRLVVACANPVLHPDLTHTASCCAVIQLAAAAIHSRLISSVCPGK